MRSSNKGFTMIELLVVLLIIGILAAVAAPMYLIHTEKAKASEAVGVLSLIRQAEREYYTVHTSYLAVAAGDIENDPADASPGLGVIIGPSQYFSQESYSVSNSTVAFSNGKTAANFLITADGSSSVAFAAATNSGARNNNDVSNYKAEMDNSGEIFFTSDGGSTWKSYK